jgi:hypothetical protein
MADNPHRPVTLAAYDARLVQAARDTLQRSRKLLDQTKGLVTAAEGGSVIGNRGPNPGECDPADGMKPSLDG